ncbi:MAG: TlpA disulfide reductase family protein [Pseudomonadota bacterium]|jgi:thiol-disulfide isomerase/thioredoxin|nr:TlpA disulfide reductase family protein [Pseudomonadota bacterium]
MSRGSKIMRGALAAALILAAGVAGYALRAARPTAAPLVPAPLVRSSPAIPAPAARRGRHAPPAALPEIPFRDRHGRLRRFADWGGRPLLVNFWAPWCSPCRAEVPLLEQLSRTRPQGLQVIGVAVDARPAVLRYARQAGIRYPLLIGLRPGMRAIRALGMVAAFPFSVFVDAHGRIVTVEVGRLHATEVHVILERIGALDRGQISLSAARGQISAEIAQQAARRAKHAQG